MRAHELFEFKLIKHDEGFKIWQNPTANDIRAIIKNTWVATNVPPFEPDEDAPFNDEDEYLRGSVHGLDYPLRGLITDNTVYIVDSYYADHDTLSSILYKQGITQDSFDYTPGRTSQDLIPLVIEKHEEGSLSGVRDDPDDYMIGVPPKYVDIVKTISTVTMMNLPIEAWN